MSTHDAAMPMGKPSNQSRMLRWWSPVAGVLLAGTFLEAVFAGALLSGVEWARLAHATTATLLAVFLLAAAPAYAQHEHQMPETPPAEPQDEHAGHDMQGMDGMQGMEGMDHMDHGMHAMFGSYSMTREASGTSWQPDSSPHSGLHRMAGGWELMLHGFVQGIYDDQDGPRGGPFS